MNRTRVTPAEKGAAAGSSNGSVIDRILNCLLVFIPLTVLLEAVHADPLWLFFSSALAIVPLAGKIGEATEELGKRVGSHIGGILNATFGNLAELIIAVLAINAGLIELVKASLTGSIIANLLFVLGASFLIGGLKFKEQEFSMNLANLLTTMLLIAIMSMLIPSIISVIPEGAIHEDVHSLSLAVAALLFIMYALSIVFSLLTHRELFRSDESFSSPPKWTFNYSLFILVLSVVAVTFMSEVFVGTVKHFSDAFSLSEIFVGAVIVALVGNAAEHFSAVMFTMKNKVDLAFNIAVGSSIQIATFVLPVVVFYSVFAGKPMDIVFTVPEMLALVSSAFILNEIAKDGRANWFEGAQLLVMYLIIAAFFLFYK